MHPYHSVTTRETWVFWGLKCCLAVICAIARLRDLLFFEKSLSFPFHSLFFFLFLYSWIYLLR